MSRHCINGINAVVNEIGLPAPGFFPKDRFCRDFVIVFCHIGLDRVAAAWRLGNGHHIPHPGEAHMKRSRDRRRRQGQYVDGAVPGFPLFFLYHAKALFLVNDQKAQTGAFDLFRQNRMGPDEHVQRPRFKFLQNGSLLFGRAEPV